MLVHLGKLIHNTVVWQQEGMNTKYETYTIVSPGLDERCSWIKSTVSRIAREGKQQNETESSIKKTNIVSKSANGSRQVLTDTKVIQPHVFW